MPTDATELVQVALARGHDGLWGWVAMYLNDIRSGTGFESMPDAVRSALRSLRSHDIKSVTTDHVYKAIAEEAIQPGGQIKITVTRP